MGLFSGVGKRVIIAYGGFKTPTIEFYIITCISKTLALGEGELSTAPREAPNICAFVFSVIEN
ncbi:MAG: hypothetical protein R2769_13905 [Saprospiraceae bacterium]